MSSMFQRLDEVEARYEELGRSLSSPEVINNREKFRAASKEHSELSEVVATYRAYRKAGEELKGSKELLASSSDAEMLALAKEELNLLQKELEGLESKLKLLLVPKDPNDEKNVILEIRAGAGGDEAGIFAAELLRLYTRYGESCKFKVELLGLSDSGAGGYKEAIAMITGRGAFSKFKYERGVHRVQRVPKTEAAGRIHTSTVTVAVLPEAEEVEIEVLDKDLRIDVYRAGGPGGQSVNTTDSAVRITHLPTGIVVAMQDEKSQHKNRDKAMRVLRARLLEHKQAEIDNARRDDRRSQVGTGDRSEKVRTYNFPQSRITDHRIGLSLYNLDQVMNGDLDDVVDALTTHYQTLALQGETGTAPTSGGLIDDDD
jgi:peptide chain release factor 1